MEAAVIRTIGGTPEPATLDSPTPNEGHVVVKMLGASLNPVDLAISEGRFYSGHPPLPYAPCIEAVGQVAGRANLVYTFGGGLGVARNGAAAELFSGTTDRLIDVPTGADPATAAALGVAGLTGWLSIVWSAEVQEGETVLVLGATGATGRIALQAARAQKAGRVVATGRNSARLAAIEDLADVVVASDEPNFEERLVAVCDPGAHVVFDPLWGQVIVVALAAARPGARVIHLGTSAGPEATIPSSLVRGKQLRIEGFSVFAVPWPVISDTYRSLVKRSAAGELVLPTRSFPLEEAAQAWEALRTGDGKSVIVP